MVVVKRNGKQEEYDGSKIILAIGKAVRDTGKEVSDDILNKIENDVKTKIENSSELWTVEMVSDSIEKSLMSLIQQDEKFYNIAKSYVLYRKERSVERDKGWELEGLQKDIYEQKYRFKNESFDQFLERVSGGNQKLKKIIRDKKFLFGGRILANRKLNKLDNRKITLSNCYVITSPDDNLESIFEVAQKLARTYSYGGGCGVDISKLRPSGAKVNNNAETTSGAISFMSLYSLTTGLIGQKGRRGALMISISTDHPDIEEFINIKSDLESVTKANISLFADDKFLIAVKNKSKHMTRFIVEGTGEVIEKEVDAYEIFRKLCYNSWDVAEPAILYRSRIDSYHLMQHDEDFHFDSVNPCAEEPLPAGGSCLLGSMNLAKFVKHPYTKDSYFDYEDFKYTVQQCVIGLNEVLDEGLPLHPLQEQRDTVAKLRQIGLGIMGIADMLIQLGIRYGSDESIKLCDKIGFVMADKAISTSSLLAKDFGTFPAYKKDAILKSDYLLTNTTSDTFDLVEKYGLRNSQILTIAPTGSLSTMLGISGGIEPIFNISYTRKTQTLNNGEETLYKVYTPIAEAYMKTNNIENEQDLPEIFVTAMTLKPIERIKMQAVWQNHIDASISSTVNLHKEATVEDIEEIYMQAWQYGLKGITVYRDGCRRGGILINEEEQLIQSDYTNMTAEEIDDTIKKLQELKESKQIVVETDLSPKCPVCGEKINHSGGCKECPNCGWSACSI